MPDGGIRGYIQTVCIEFMCVSSFNNEARRLYERLGYQVVGELTDYLVRGHSEILLRKTTGPLAGFTAEARRG